MSFESDLNRGFVPVLLQDLLLDYFVETQPKIEKSSKPCQSMIVSTDGAIKVHNQNLETRQVKRALKRLNSKAIGEYQENKKKAVRAL